MYGCGNCHPLAEDEPAKHMDGIIEVELHDSRAPDGSIKALNPSSARYSGGTCMDVYCHSSGSDAPTYVETPDWGSGHLLGPKCTSCHDNPPQYPSAGPGVAGANSHVQTLDEFGFVYVWGHFGGLPGAYHFSNIAENFC
jgi:predicted CxxxxCH...CXXCH cytochrome family protein